MPRFRRPVLPQQQRGNLRPGPVNPSVVAPGARTVVPTVVRQVTVPPTLTSRGLNRHTVVGAPTVRPPPGTIVHTVMAPPPAAAHRHATGAPLIQGGPPGRRF